MMAPGMRLTILPLVADQYGVLYWPVMASRQDKDLTRTLQVQHGARLSGDARADVTFDW